MWGIMPVCGGDGKDGNGELSSFWNSSALVNPYRNPGAPGAGQIGNNITPLGASAGCLSRLQYFNQDAKGDPVQKSPRGRPGPRPEGEEREAGHNGNSSGVIQLVPTEA